MAGKVYRGARILSPGDWLKAIMIALVLAPLVLAAAAAIALS